MADLVGVDVVSFDKVTGEVLPHAEIQLNGGDNLNTTAATNKDGYIFTNVGKGPGVVKLQKEGYEDLSVPVVFPTPSNSKYYLNPIAKPQPWNTLTYDEIVKFRGNFCGLTLNYLTPFNNPTPSLLFSPAYDCYNDEIRARILKDYSAKYPKGTFSLEVRQGGPYRDHYPDIQQSHASRNLEEIYNAGLVPLVTLMRDEDEDLDVNLPLDKIRLAMVKYEMNQPDNNETYRMAEEIYQCVTMTRKDCVVFVHFSRSHSAGIGDQPLYYNPSTYEPYPEYREGCATIEVENGEGPWWNWLANLTARIKGNPKFTGILFQNDLDATVQDCFDRDSDFTIRFGTGYHNWPIGCLFVQYERDAARAYDGSMSTDEEDIRQNELTVMTYPGMQPAGRLNGGTI